MKPAWSRDRYSDAELGSRPNLVPSQHGCSIPAIPVGSADEELSLPPPPPCPPSQCLLHPPRRLQTLNCHRWMNFLICHRCFRFQLLFLL